MAEITKKYLDLAGLTQYDGLIKAWVNGRITAEKYDDSALQSKVGALETLTSDYATVKSNAANSVAAWTKFLAGSFTTEVTPTLAQLATKDDLSTEIGKAVSGLKGTATSGYDTLGGLEAKIKEVASNLTDKNVSAEGETGDAALVSASASGNKVTVASTAKLQGAVALAESALQAGDVTVATGEANGTIKVDGKEVAVKGLGSAAYTESTDYDAAGAAADAGAAAIAAAKAHTAEREVEIDKKWAAADAALKTELQGYADGKASAAQTAAVTSANAYTDELEEEINGKITTIENAIKGGTHFIGVLEALPETVKAGDIFVAKSDFSNFKKDLEYIYDGENWYELGDSSANAQAIANLESNKADKATTYTKTEVDAIKSGLETYADDAEAAAIAAAASDATTKAGTAETNAKNYVDGRFQNEVTGKFDTVGSAEAAETAAKAYADGLVTDAEGKSRFDAAGSAKDAEDAAKLYADGLFGSIGAIDIADIEGIFTKQQ